MIEQSSDITEIAKAMVNVQRDLEGAKKDSLNPFHKSKYADLTSVWNACREPLGKNGLSVLQTGGYDESGRVLITTMLLHTSGQWIRDTLGMDPKDKTPQGVGSAITYGRRYGLSAMIGVCPEDDDAEQATHGGPKSATQVRAAFQAPAPKATPAVSGNIVRPGITPNS